MASIVSKLLAFCDSKAPVLNRGFAVFFIQYNWRKGTDGNGVSS